MKTKVKMKSDVPYSKDGVQPELFKAGETLDLNEREVEVVVNQLKAGTIVQGSVPKINEASNKVIEKKIREMDEPENKDAADQKKEDKKKKAEKAKKKK